MKYLITFLLTAMLCLEKSNAQSIVNVNTLTGAPSVVIPIDEVRKGGLSVPISLVYSNSGIRPKDVEMSAGMGWQISAGGAVSRVLRGLPDDVKRDHNGGTALGWIYNTNQSKIASFIPSNNGSTCANETTDINYINTNFTSNSDTEPDLFYVSAPGLSCQLVWDQSLATPGFRTIPYRDYVVTPAFDSATGLITSFSITNDQGTKYVFATRDTVWQTAKMVDTSKAINFFKSGYNQYVHGIIYFSSWHLTSMTDQNGNGIQLVYNTSPRRTGRDTISLWQGGSAGAKTHIAVYANSQTVTVQTLKSIGQFYDAEYDPIFTFNYSTANTNQTIINSITGLGKNYQFEYSSVAYVQPNYPDYNRQFLRHFYSSGCSSPVNYHFGYDGESGSGNNWTTSLADSTSRKLDYWGYHTLSSGINLLPSIDVNPANPNYPRYGIHVTATPGSDYTNAISGSDRSANAGSIAGSLNKIYYATGGNTTIIYESNDYLDVPSNTTVFGGGIRVKQIVDSAITSNVALIRNFKYQPLLYVDGKSSGKPVSLPQFAFTVPYTGTATGNDYWGNSTVFSETDLSGENHTIMYEYVWEIRPGSGATLYQYYLPATYWDNSATPVCASCTTADWAQSMNYAGRSNCSLTYGSVVNSTRSYPFAPNPNYDFERGVLRKTMNTDVEGTEMSEVNYTYQRTSAPVFIPALSFEDMIANSRTVRTYNKYSILASAGELTASVSKKVFDLGGVTSIQMATNYTYNTTQHKMISEAVTNSDGSVLTTKIQYAKDFVTTASNADIVALNTLKTKNINVPVESYQQVTRAGVTKTVDANLTRFRLLTINGQTSALPLQQLKFYDQDGVTNFIPYSTSAGTPAAYSGYLPVMNYNKYDEFGNLISTDDAHKHARTVIENISVNAPAAIFSNAGASETGIMDFDSYTGTGPIFSISGTMVPVTGDGHNGNSEALSTNQTVSRTFVRNPNVNRYIFSIWIKSTAGASNSLTFSLTPTAGGSPSTYIKSYTGTGAWQYCQFNLPVNNMGSGFTLGMTSNANIGIDDIIAYPENCEVLTYSYDAATRMKSSETNTNGISTYYTYDMWGRLLYVFDRDKNIIKKNTYVMPADAMNSQPVDMGIVGNLLVNSSISFSFGGYTPCTSTGISAHWDFGDGNTANTNNSSIYHSYTAAGTYTVTLTTTSPLYGTQTVSRTVTISAGSPPPNYVVINYTNYTTSNGSVNDVVFNNGVDPIIDVPASSLNGYHIPKSTHPYIITVYMTGTQYNAGTDSGYGCVKTSTSCIDYNVHNSYAFLSVNFSTIGNFGITIYKTNCANSNPPIED